VSNVQLDMTVGRGRV